MGMEQDILVGKRVLVIGVTGLIGRGLSYVLAKNNEVHGLCRFKEPELRE